MSWDEDDGMEVTPFAKVKLNGREVCRVKDKPEGLVVTLVDREGWEELVLMPWCWEICGTCRGNGKHSHRFGAITAEDRERDWDDEEWDHYMRGDYDAECESCGGSGKIRVLDDKCFSDEWKKAMDKYYQDEADYRAEVEAERRFGC